MKLGKKLRKLATDPVPPDLKMAIKETLLASAKRGERTTTIYLKESEVDDVADWLIDEKIHILTIKRDQNNRRQLKVHW